MFWENFWPNFWSDIVVGLIIGVGVVAYLQRKERTIEKKGRGNTKSKIDTFSVRENSVIWLKGIIIQGNRILNRHETLKESFEVEGIQKIYEIRKAKHQLTLEENFFAIAVKRSRNWLKELVKIEEEFETAIKMFLGSTTQAENIRDMREHEIDYFRGKGRKQEKYEHAIKKGDSPRAIVADASSTIVEDDNNYKIGGRLHVQKTMKSANSLLEKMGGHYADDTPIDNIISSPPIKP